MKLTNIFKEFFRSERAGGFVLIASTFVSLMLTNALPGLHYEKLWHFNLLNTSIEHIINDGLMAVFFLLIALELERELYIGELSNIKNAMLPISSAIGGMLIPAAIFLVFNFGTASQPGAGIPMATDIAFALGILSLLGSRVPLSLKVFLTALAVIDDLGAIIVIAVFYTKDIVWGNLLISLLIFSALIIANRLKVKQLTPYLIGGALMWYFMLQSGVHSTISGVLLAFAIPFRGGDENSPSSKLQHFLHYPVAFLVLPLFALANTAIKIDSNFLHVLSERNSIGIIAGLFIGKPLGITLFALLAVKFRLSSLPEGVSWKNIIGIGFLGGIGFTMSIFIAILAFNETAIINNSKMMILLASLISGSLGLLWLRLSLPPKVYADE